MFRTLKAALRRRSWAPPHGATHVLQWQPSARIVPDPGTDGWWEIQPVTAWLAGEHADGMPDEDGGPDRTWKDLFRFTAAALGYGVTMISFETGIEADGLIVPTPAYWLIPAVA